MLDHEIEGMIEGLYWEFDAAKNGYAEYKGHPQSERDAFKQIMRKMVKALTEDRQNR